MIFASHSYDIAFEDQLEQSLKLNFTGNQAPNSLLLEFGLLRFKTFASNIAGQGLVEATFTADAKYLSTSATQMTITLVNTQEVFG